MVCTREYELRTYRSLFAQALECVPPEPEDAVLPLKDNLSPDGEWTVLRLPAPCALS